jgi:hypothetical protein
MEVVFSLAGEMLFLQGVLPGKLGLVGVALTIVGLVAYTVLQTKSN